MKKLELKTVIAYYKMEAIDKIIQRKMDLIRLITGLM